MTGKYPFDGGVPNNIGIERIVYSRWSILEGGRIDIGLEALLVPFSLESLGAL